LLAHYRGCIGLGPAPVQALERAVLGVVGWDLLSWPRSGGDLGDGRFQLRAESPDGLRSWAARVSEGRLLPVPNCGQSPDQATKFEAEWLVDGLCGESG
ncbi:MAG: sucrase ferredoxin, partial [Acidimicrobiales bacterium]